MGTLNPALTLWTPPPSSSTGLLKELQQGSSPQACTTFRRILHLTSLLPTFCNKALELAESLLQSHVRAAAASAPPTSPPLALSRLVEFSHITKCSEALLSHMAHYNTWAPQAWADTILHLQKHSPSDPFLRASLAQTLQNLNQSAEELLSIYENLRKMQGPILMMNTFNDDRDQTLMCNRPPISMWAQRYPSWWMRVYGLLFISIALACGLAWLCPVPNNLTG